MARELYCTGCGQRINNIPIIGEKSFEFEDGTYCERCAKIKVDKNRKKLKWYII